MSADALYLARQLASTVQDQLQKQRDDARDREQRAMDRELHQQQVAQDREQRAMDLEFERERRADVRDSRLFDHFRDYLDTTRSDLKDASLVRERAAGLELQLKHSEERAAAVAAAAVERSNVAHDDTQPISGTSIQTTHPNHSIVDALPVVSHVFGASTLKSFFFNEK